jgi:hypothetical protein
VFGMVAYGSSPLVATNVFTGNGVEGAPLPEELTVLLNPVGAVRGGLALLPFAGWEASGFDDGDPLNDLLATPRIGGPGIENEFRGNGAVDVYALDTRPHSWETVEHDNHYLEGGAGLRLQQDWLGLIRVEDEEGLPVTGAAVSVADSTGLLVAAFPSGEAGFAAAGADPDRPMRLAGPWTRFTEYVVSRSGKRAPRTPHRVAASAEGRTGRTCYSWDGLDNDPAGSYILNARYQTVVVRLSAADWSACHRTARR